MTFEDEIREVNRVNNSANGNPRWRVAFASGKVLDTEPDAAVNHKISNSEYKGQPLLVETTPNGRLIRAIYERPEK